MLPTAFAVKRLQKKALMRAVFRIQSSLQGLTPSDAEKLLGDLAVTNRLAILTLDALHLVF